ncbi:type II toxin-antitoxin system RelE/ParE family toxin [Mucilaginibacter sp.]|uniref:type II toxin-antitoxin system RelE/ParE family toxin n=1 Tax=Mucilaginibacter sp. TaxID=1882438 RepID=UPI000CA72A93|nr:MAG: hypothetical protein C0154_10615 [Mucilaginibacter sp.]HEK21049.1 type II toxin-antitoxin system RelE/ParE family toxin [Bacteroidota bacterium]
MTYLIQFSDKAQYELFDGWAWYEKQQIGLGDKFENEVYKKISFVQSNPLIYEKQGNFRQANTEIFPYLIVFRINEHKKMIFIVSVFHTRRNPHRKLR